MVVVPHDLPEKLESCLIHTNLFLGTLPTTTGTTVTVLACQRGFLKCCDLSFPIDVLNCGGFNVFRLTSTPACPGRYCTGLFYLSECLTPAQQIVGCIMKGASYLSMRRRKYTTKIH